MLERLTPRRILRSLQRRLRELFARRTTPASEPQAPAVAPPIVARGAIDHPDAFSALTRGEVNFGGWALVGQGTATSVRLVVNGDLEISATLGLDRPDVPIALGEPEATAACGWAARLDLRSLPPGDARVQLYVSGDEIDAPTCVADRLYPLRGHGIVGNIDFPKDGARIHGELLVVLGWVHTPRTVDYVEVECDGTILGLARLGLGRLDVESSSNGDVGPLSGFEFRGVVDMRDGGERLISVTATDFDGSRALLGVRSVTFQSHEPTSEEASYGARLRQLNSESLASTRGAAARTPRHVLAFTHSLALGGGQLYLQDLIKELLPRLDGCTVMTPVGGALGPELESLGVDVVISGRGWTYDIASYEGHIRELQHLIAGSACGIVLLNTLGQFAAADAAQRVGVPTIWALHESMELADWIDRNSVGTPVSAYVHSRIETTLRGATRLVFEADATRRVYLQLGGDPSRAVTQAYAVDAAAIDAHAESSLPSAMREAYDLPFDATVLLCVGVFEERKSQGSLIEAFRLVADAHPHAILVLVGDHPCAYSEALHRAVPDHLASRIRFVPITPDIWNWYQVADVLVSASDVESLPRSMLESMLFECPVLSVSVFGVPELIRDGENGWLVEGRDTKSLVAGLHRVLRLDTATRKETGAKGRALVLDHYRSDRFGDAYLKMIDELGLR